MNRELLEAVEVSGKGKNVAKDTLIEMIENFLLTVCKNRFGKADNVKITVNPNTCNFATYVEKAVVENVGNGILEISLADTKMLNPKYEAGGTVQVPLDSKRFGRIATQNVKNVILQKVREEERKVFYNEYYTKEKGVMTGIAQRHLGRNAGINLGRVDAILNESEQVRGETFRPTERIKVCIIEVKDTPKGPRVSVSRTHPDLAKRLFESGVAEVRDSTVEIKTTAGGAGFRAKIAVRSDDPNVGPVGVHVGLNGARVNSTVNGLRGKEIDIINWDDNPAYLIENALSPAKMIYVVAGKETWEAQVIVPDHQLSLAIGKEGQNARLTVGLTGLEIDIKSETQAGEMGLFEQMGLRYGDTPAASFKEETYERPENYQEYQEGYQEGVNEQE